MQHWKLFGLRNVLFREKEFIFRSIYSGAIYETTTDCDMCVVINGYGVRFMECYILSFLFRIEQEGIRCFTEKRKKKKKAVKR